MVLSTVFFPLGCENINFFLCIAYKVCSHLQSVIFNRIKLPVFIDDKMSQQQKYSFNLRARQIFISLKIKISSRRRCDHITPK